MRRVRSSIAASITALGLVIFWLAFSAPDLRSAALVAWLVGDVFGAVGSGSYDVFSNGGAFKETITDGLGGFTTGCAFNTDRSKLYTTNFSSGQIVKYDDADPHNHTSFVTAGQGSPESITFKMNGGYFVGAPFVPIIVEYDSADNVVMTHMVAPADGTGGTDWIDLSVNQTTLFYSDEGRLIKRFDTVSGQLADFATLPGGGDAFAIRLLPPFDGTGGLLVADNGDVKRLDASGNVIRTYGITGVAGFFGLNLDPDGITFWTGSFGNGVLYRFNIATGGIDNAIQMIDTMHGSNALFGVCLKGEITGGGGTPTPTPVPGPTPIIHVRATPARTREGGSATFFVEADRVLSGAVTVNYSMSGNATKGDDYDLTPPCCQATIPAGEMRTPVVLDSFQDGERERRGESAVMMIEPGAGYEVTTSRRPPTFKATIKIID